ncbi:MAG: serine protease [Planctomycetota bacterium]
MSGNRLRCVPALAAAVVVGCVLHATLAAGQCVGPLCPPAAWQPAASARYAPAPAAACRVIARTATGTNFGSGALVHSAGSRGYVLTCEHVVADAAAGVSVVFAGGQAYSGRVVAAEAGPDLAVVEIAAPPAEPFRLAMSVGDRWYTAGGFGSDGRYRTVSGPVVGQATAAGARAPSLVIRGAVRSGDSGGPVLTPGGELVGVVWGVRNGASYASFGRPVQDILRRVVVRAQKPAPGEDSPASTPEADAATQKRLAALEQRVQSIKPCPCDGGCVQASDLQRFATREELNRLATEADLRRGELLGRVDQAETQSASAARRAAADAVAERLRDLRATARAYSTLQVVLGSLGIGGPAGVALFAVGWLAKRRRGRRRASRGVGGPRPEGFPGGRTAERPLPVGPGEPEADRR